MKKCPFPILIKMVGKWQKAFFHIFPPRSFKSSYQKATRKLYFPIFSTAKKTLFPIHKMHSERESNTHYMGTLLVL